MTTPPFVGLKFLGSNDDPTEYVEVGLTKWLIGDLNDLDDDMVLQTYWPPRKVSATFLIKTQQDAETSWPIYDVVIMRFFETFTHAREVMPKLAEDSMYETEVEAKMGRGFRKRQRNRALSSSSESGDEAGPVVKRSKKSVEPPPVISLSRGEESKVTQSKKVIGVPRKGQTTLSKAEQQKQHREELMEMLKQARARAAEKMNQATSPPTPAAPAAPVTTGMTSPWKVSPCLYSGSPKCVEKTNPSPCVSPSVSPLHDAAPGPSSVVNTSFNDFLSGCAEEHNGDSDVDILGIDSSAHDKNADCGPSSRQSNFSTLFVEDHNNDHDRGHQDSSKQKKGNGSEVQQKSSSNGKRKLFQEDTLEKRVMTIEATVNRMNVTMIEISKKFDITLMNLGRIQKAVNPSERRISIPKNMPHLPLDSREALNRFEAFLGETDIHLAAVVDYMANFIRKTCAEPEKKSATNILTKLLTNNLAKEVNLDGGNNKVAFRALNLNKVFEGTLQEAFPDSDLGDAKGALRSWLKDAKWRKQLKPVTSPKKSSRPSTSAPTGG